MEGLEESAVPSPSIGRRTLTDVDVTVEAAGLPAGRIPKKLFGVCLSYKGESYPDWESPKPGKTFTVPKHRKKRHYFMFTKESSRKKLLAQISKHVGLEDHTVTVMDGAVEWSNIEEWTVEDESVS